MIMIHVSKNNSFLIVELSLSVHVHMFYYIVVSPALLAYCSPLGLLAYSVTARLYIIIIY